jgi:hypothetical protein
VLIANKCVEQKKNKKAHVINASERKENKIKRHEIYEILEALDTLHLR